jgi:glycosyltransferase involved in cell wall biosynthesis
MAGFEASRGRYVVTLDGDLQNDPADIPKLLAKLEEGFEIVTGWRRSRQDKLVSRRLPSIAANAFARKMTGLTIHDNGCALRHIVATSCDRSRSTPTSIASSCRSHRWAVRA